MVHKVHYFALPGRAEVARLCLAVGNQPYEDVVYTRDTFPAFKAKAPFGQVPVLELPDGRMLAQSGAIDRYCAKLGGLYPEDPWAAAMADQAVFQLSDAMDLLTPTFAIPDLDERIKARQAILEGKFKERMAALQNVIEPVEASGKFVAGDKLSYADLAIFNGLSGLISGFMDGIPKDLLKDYPVLKAFRNRIASLPAIKEFYEKHTDNVRVAYKPDA